MQVAIIGDTHLPRGTREIPAACLARCRAADAILHVGDFVDLAALKAVRQLGPPVHAVWGNIDTAEVQAALPERLVVELVGVRVGMVHIPGPRVGRTARLRRWFPDCDAAVFGHTHMPEHDQLDDGFQIFNPGSPTERRRAPTRTMGLATITDAAIDFALVEV